MDDYGVLYSTYMSTVAVAQWYLSMSTYGGLEGYDGYEAAEC